MKKYTKPEIEISVFATEDIITASGTTVVELESGEALSDTITGVSYDTLDWQ